MDCKMPLDSTDAFKTMELLELYRSKLSDTTDRNLIEAIEKVVDVFNSQFFIALLEIQRYYNEILSNNGLSVSEKTKETLNLLNYLKIYPSSASCITNSCPISRRLGTDIKSFNKSLKEEVSLPMTTPSIRNSASVNFVDNETSSDMNNGLSNKLTVHSLNNELESRPVVIEAVIMRDERGFGFSVAGGIDNPYLHPKDPGIYITKISPGGPVDLCARLKVNDRILTVNGIDMTHLTHENAVNSLKQVGRRLKLVVQREPEIKIGTSALEYMRKRTHLSSEDSQKIERKSDGHQTKSASQVSLAPEKKNPCHNSKTASMPSNLNQVSNPSNILPRSRTVTVSLVKDDRGLGFSIGGGRGNEHFFGDPGIYITKITKHGVASKVEVIDEGDKLLQVNDYLFTNITHEDAVNILHKVGPSVKLKIFKNTIGVPKDIITRDISEQCSINGSPGRLEYTELRMNDDDSLMGDSTNDYVDKSPRLVVIDRRHESINLGFNIVGGEDEDGIFVSVVKPGGMADATEDIFVGDRIWQVNGIDISVATNSEAVAILKGTGRKVELLLTTDVNEYLAYLSKSGSSDVVNSNQSQYIPCNSMSTPNLPETTYREAVNSKTLHSNIKIDDHIRSVGCDLDQHLLSENSPKMFRGRGLHKSYKSFDVFSDDPQNTSSGSNHTDLISDNDRDNHLVTRPRSITSSTSTDRNSTLMKTGFYVRALFDYDPDVEKYVPSNPLAFLTNDIIYVINAADPDWWQARLIEDSCDNGPIGNIPSSHRLRRKERRRKRKVNFNSEIEKRGNSNKPSFLKRNQTSGMSKSMQNIDGNISDKDYFDEKFDECKDSFYEHLVKINLDYVRPVVIIGPMREKINDMLLSQHSDLYESCVPHTTRPMRPHEIDGRDYHFVTDREEMERDINCQKFIEAGQYRDNLYGTSVEAVKAVASHKHCVLDVNAMAIKKLISSNMLPITVLIKPPSVKSLCNLSKKFTVAQADNQVKKTEELQMRLSHCFTAVVWDDDFNELYRQIKYIIQSNAGSEIWIPSQHIITS